MNKLETTEYFVYFGILTKVAFKCRYFREQPALAPRLVRTFMDSSPLLAQLKQVYKVSDKDCIRLIQLFEPLEVKKNEHLFRSGEIARHVYFVEQGCLRQYYINNNGEERTIYFKM